jgi:hypothetical protein
MKHLTEEEMIGQIYGESENTTAVERHLADCRECAQGFAELKRDLAEVDRVVAPARDAEYGQRVWTAIAPFLAVYETEKRRWWQSVAVLRGLSFGVAGALLMACAFYAGRLFEQKQRPPVVAQENHAPTPQVKQPIVVVVLDDHLDRSERFLVQLKHADFDPESVAPMRDEAKNLLADNRICRKNAAQSNDPELTTALDHLDSLLAETANQPGGLNAASIAKLQDEMNSEGVLFEVRVLRSRMAHHPETANNPETGGNI